MEAENENLEISEEEQALREEVFAEVFDGEVPETAAEPDEESDDTENQEDTQDVEDTQEDSNEDEDPMAGIPAALRDQIEGISNRLNTLGVIEERLKQTERRIGSIQNEFHAAKQAASEKKADAPTEEEIAAAAKNKADWDELKEDFPEWAAAIESKLAATSAELTKKLPNVSDLQKGLNDIQAKQGSFVSNSVLEERLLSVIHPGWKDTVKTPEYRDWIGKQSQDIQDRHYKGETADDAAFVLNRFKDFQSNEKSPQEIVAARKKRLERAGSKNIGGHKTKPQKSESEMSEDELRDLEFGRIWG